MFGKAVGTPRTNQLGTLRQWAILPPHSPFYSCYKGSRMITYRDDCSPPCVTAELSHGSSSMMMLGSGCRACIQSATLHVNFLFASNSCLSQFNVVRLVPFLPPLKKGLTKPWCSDLMRFLVDLLFLLASETFPSIHPFHHLLHVARTL